MPTADDYLSMLAPELSSVSTGDRALALSLADQQTGTVFPGDVRLEYVALVAARLLTLRDQAASGGAVSSKTVGPLSISYATTAPGSTRFDGRLEELRNAFVVGPRTSFSGSAGDPSGDAP